MKKFFSILLVLAISATFMLFSGCTPAENKVSKTYIGTKHTTKYSLIINDTTTKDSQIYSFGISDDSSPWWVEERLISMMNNKKYSISSVEIFYMKSSTLSYNKGDITNFKLNISEDLTKPSLRMKMMVMSDFLLNDGSNIIDKAAVGVEVKDFLKLPSNDSKFGVYYIFYIES